MRPGTTLLCRNQIVLEYPDKKDVLDAATAHKLQNMSADEVREFLTARAKLKPGEVDPDGIPVGASKLGGAPDIPEGFIWPMVEGNAYTTDEDAQDAYLNFIIQLNCKELSELDTEGLLPKDGLISVFYDNTNQPCGYDQSHKEGLKVFYFEDINSLHRATPEESKAGLIKFGTSLTACKQVSSICVEDADAVGVDPGERKGFISNSGKLGPILVLGWEIPFQGDPKLDASATNQGIYCGGVDTNDPVPYNEILKNWLLLVQVNMFDFLTPDIDYSAAPVEGFLYIEIPKDALLNKDFSQARPVFQFD